MLLRKLGRAGRLAGIVGAALIVTLTPSARAQIVPTGTHSAARPSDTGFEGAVNSAGAYGASVPLNFPPARGGLPISVQIVYGDRSVGAVGLGWDIPTSFIRRDGTIAHRRPANLPDATLQPREQLSLMLEGQRTDLVRNASNTAWLARRRNAQIEVREVGNGSMLMIDGDGHIYNFSTEGGSAGSRLDGGNLYLLKDITGPGGNRVHLEYKILAPALPDGATGLSINLVNVSYNYSDAAGN
jgi:hypothetical protein